MIFPTREDRGSSGGRNYTKSGASKIKMCGGNPHVSYIRPGIVADNVRFAAQGCAFRRTDGSLLGHHQHGVPGFIRRVLHQRLAFLPVAVAQIIIRPLAQAVLKQDQRLGEFSFTEQFDGADEQYIEIIEEKTARCDFCRGDVWDLCVHQRYVFNHTLVI